MSSVTSLTPLPYPDPTDQPFVHLDIKALAEAASSEIWKRSLGILGRAQSVAAVAGSGTVGTYTQIGALDVPLTLARNTRVKVTFNGAFSVTGVGPNDVTIQLRYDGSTVIATGRVTQLPTNGNASTVIVDCVDLPAGTYTFSAWFAVTVAGGAVNPQFRGNIHQGALIVEDGGTY